MRHTNPKRKRGPRELPRSRFGLVYLSIRSHLFSRRSSRDRRSRINARLGFTLLEMTVVVLLIGILAAVAVPSFTRSLFYHQANAAAQRVKLELEHARKRAKMTGLSQTMDFFTTDSSFQLRSVNDLNRQGSWYKVELRFAPYNSKMTTANFGGDGVVIFNGFGIPDSGGQVAVTSGTFQFTVTLNAVTGLASIP